MRLDLGFSSWLLFFGCWINMIASLSNLKELARLAEWDLGNDIKSLDSGAKYMVACPFASKTHARGYDAHPSFLVNVAKLDYHCFSCKQHGRLHTLPNSLMREDVRTLSPPQAARFINACLELAQRHNANPNQTIDDDVQMIAPAIPLGVYKAMFGEAYKYEQAIDYLAERKVSLDTAEKLDVRYSTKDNAVVVPWFHLGMVVGYALRYLAPKPDQPKIIYRKHFDKTKYILGMHLWTKAKPVLLVEGLFAYLRAHEERADRYFDIGAVGGSNVAQAQVSLLVSNNRAVYGLFDPDKAGMLGLYGRYNSYSKTYTGGLVNTVGEHLPVFIPVIPDHAVVATGEKAGEKDVDELVDDDYLAMRRFTLPYARP